MESDDNSLKDNVIWDIYQDKNQLLWISTDTGLHTLILIPDSRAKPRFNSVKITDFTGTLSEVKTIFQDKNNNYWLGSYDNGIHLANENLTYIGSLQAKNKVDLHINANTLFDLKEIDGQLWLATDNGLFIVSPVSKNKYQLDSHINTEGIVKKSSNNDENINKKQTLLSNHIRSIVQYDDNNVWLATDKGLNVINLLNDTISSQQKNSYKTSLSENWLMAIFKDDNDTIWLGSYGGGLNKYSPLSAKLYHGLAELDISTKQNFRVESFTQANDGTVYLSTEQQGVFKVEGKKVSKLNIPLTENIRQILSRNINNLLLITNSGKLLEYHIKKKILKEHTNWRLDSNHSFANLITIHSTGLWFIDQQGMLTQYSIDTQDFSRYPSPDNNVLTSLTLDNKNSLWLASKNNNILHFQLNSLTFTESQISIPLHFNMKQTVSIVSNTRYIWLGSRSQGLVSINLQNNNINFYNEDNGLKNNYIASILIDQKKQCLARQQ